MNFRPQNIPRGHDQETAWESEFESLSAVSRIGENDLPYLRQILAGEENADSYITSAAYYSFTGRRGLWMYKKEDAFLFVCWHPNVQNQILVFPQLGKNDGDLINDLLKEIPTPPEGIRIARVKTTGAVTNDNFQFNGRIIDLKTCEEDVLDWKYPVRILATADLANLEGSKYQQIRHKVKQLEKQNVEVVPFNAIEHSRALENLLHRWASKNASSRREYELLYAPYEALFSQGVEKTSGLSGIMIFIDGQMQAIGLWDISNARRKTANLFVNFSNTEFKGISEYLTVKCCETLCEQGISYLNLGGSEGKGLDTFKTRFRPAMSIGLGSIDVEINDSPEFAAKRTPNATVRHDLVRGKTADAN